jgi:isopentenyldiphosphate isomerase
MALFCAWKKEIELLLNRERVDKMELWDILGEQGNKTGRTIVRGEKLKEDEYHLVVHIWILNDKNEFLIQKRAEHLKLMPGLWAATGGSVIAGEDSLTGAIREVKEELGIDVDIANLTKLRRIKRKNNLSDVWLVRQNVSLEDVIVQVEEVSQAKWAAKEDIENMVEEGTFFNYGDEYFNFLFCS